MFFLEEKKLPRTCALRKACALVALPMGHEIPNAVVDCGSPPNTGAAWVALPFGGKVANVVIVPQLGMRR
jgi:hypothetical protein